MAPILVFELTDAAQNIMTSSKL